MVRWVLSIWCVLFWSVVVCCCSDVISCVWMVEVVLGCMVGCGGGWGGGWGGICGG